MPYTISGRNLMLDALRGTNPAAPITHLGLFTDGAGKSVTGVASTDVLTSAAHGYSNGDLVFLSALTGGTGLVSGRPYFVVASATNTFQLALTVGGTAVDFTTDLTVGTVTRSVELSGGSPAYARGAIAFAAAAGGLIDDSTNGVTMNVPAATTVNRVGCFSASTAGTLQEISPVTAEVFAGQGTYTVTDAKLDLLAAGGS